MVQNSNARPDIFTLRGLFITKDVIEELLLKAYSLIPLTESKAKEDPIVLFPLSAYFPISYMCDMSLKGIFKEEFDVQLVPSLVILVQSISISVKLLQSRKQSSPKLVTLLAPVIVDKLVHPLKQCQGIVVKFVGKLICYSEEHPLKQASPIYVKLLKSILIFYKLEHPSKQLLPKVCKF